MKNYFGGNYSGSMSPVIFRSKPQVATYNDLPITGNVENDLRSVEDTDHLYTWTKSDPDGSLSDWMDIGSTVGNLDTIADGSTYGRVLLSELASGQVKRLDDGSNEVTAADAKDAVDKKHTQNTDTSLDLGGSNPVTAETIKAVTDNITMNASENTTLIGIGAGNPSVITGNNNTIIGEEAGSVLTTSVSNTFIGFRAGQNYDNAVGGNVFIGYLSGDTATGNNLVCVGKFAGRTAGSSCVFVGEEAGRVATGNFNTMIGRNAGKNNVGGSNVIIGYNIGNTDRSWVSTLAIDVTDRVDPLLLGDFSARTLMINGTLQSNDIHFFGTNVTAIGVGAGNPSVASGNNCVTLGAGAGQSLTSSSNNTLIGKDAGKDITVGFSNLIVGQGSGGTITTGDGNVIIGTQSGSNLHTNSGSNTIIGMGAGKLEGLLHGNVIIGYKVGFSNLTGSDQLAIHNDDVSDPLIYGDFSARTLMINGKLESNEITFDTTLFNTVIGNLTPTLTAVDSVIIGEKAGQNMNTTKNDNVFIGSMAGIDADGTASVAIGHSAGEHAGGSCVYIGRFAGRDNTGSDNVIIGDLAGRSTIGVDNVIIGKEACKLWSGSRSVFIGHEVNEAGTNFTGDDLLIIHNSDSATPLIQGDFSAATLKINGDLEVTGDFTPKVYAQTEEPVLDADNKIAIWKDTDDSNRIYLVFRRASGDQVSVELA